jgi:hypothetical protein
MQAKRMVLSASCFREPPGSPSASSAPRNALSCEVGAGDERAVAAIRNAAEVGAQGPLDENFDGFDFELTQDQMTAIAAMDTRTSVFFDHRDPDQVRRLGTARLDI